MINFLKCTFGGLQTSYLVRQYFFGILITAFYVSVLTSGENVLSAAMIAMFAVNTLLYPYSRFVYESIVGFVFGENVFYVNAILMLVVKAMTMVICWAAAVFIAPIGLAYIYYCQTRAES
ncbi:hypothetical protein ICR45_003371 [Vibrio cholerae]|uniref:hypothetical protein n=1 Tax=Vibrio cholerae TaxID=666 RepID=UPI000F0B6F79|nr:hypothetical protein [Vibrio cholerae]EGQ7791245.1 hypothetical protein [Vibrio cholerae]EHS1094408.1 hypothetical protein [Vibrio cholerae]EJH6267003.1 hypothetical protein [Vibrio cholerae]EJL6420784.1 hypothetical protein [Vibrio cholerae]EJL6499826.1 hypothetical protein [Vibrio cholerae]